MAKPKKTAEAPVTPVAPAAEETPTSSTTTAAPKLKPGQRITHNGNIIEVK